jgi:hypothetical protein
VQAARRRGSDAESERHEEAHVPGIPASDLSDDDLRRELRHLYETRWDTLTTGTESALETHTERMLELETEFVVRLPQEAAPDPLRTRAGRHAD